MMMEKIHAPLPRLAGGAALSAMVLASARLRRDAGRHAGRRPGRSTTSSRMDPGEAFEISAGEITGNTYDMLVRLDINDTSKVVGDVAESWTVSDDGLTYTFKLKPGLKFASGNPITAEDVAWSFERAVKLDKSPAFILHAVRPHRRQCHGKGQGRRSVDLRLHRRPGLCAELRAELPDRDRRLGRRQEAGHGACRGGDAERRLQVRQRLRQ